jgi:hypothetical protein
VLTVRPTRTSGKALEEPAERLMLLWLFLASKLYWKRRWPALST